VYIRKGEEKRNAFWKGGFCEAQKGEQTAWKNAMWGYENRLAPEGENLGQLKKKFHGD